MPDFNIPMASPRKIYRKKVAQPTGGQPDDEETPKLNGQWAHYMALELEKYRTDAVKMPHKKMRSNAKKLDEADVANAAHYYAAQPK